MLTIIDVKKGELAIVRKRGEIDNIITAGRHTFWDPFSILTFDQVDLADTKIEPDTANILINFYPQLVETFCHYVSLAADEIGLRYEEDKLVEIIMPTTKTVYWQSYKPQLLKK